MKQRLMTLFAGALLSTALVFGQAEDSAFQVRYASNLAIGDSVVNISNTGASSTTNTPQQNGKLCANVYVFDPSQEMISCCSCQVQPNSLVSLSARSDLISNTLTPGVPTSVVIKIVSSAVSGSATCNAGQVTAPATVDKRSPPPTNTNNPAPGLVAWGTTLHALPTTPVTYGVTETKFTPATLSNTELTGLASRCAFIQTTGSGFGICRSCRLGGL